MKIKDIALSAAAIGERVVKAIAIGAVEVWSAIKYIVFKDPVVAQICAENFGDGNGLTEEDAANVTDLGTIFQGNTEITSFDELSDFGVVELKANAFKGCTNLKSIDLTKVEKLSDDVFKDCSSLAIDVNMPNLKGFNSYYNTPFTRSGIVTISNLGAITYIPSYYTDGGFAEGCTSLIKVVLPPTCKTIGNGSDIYCLNAFKDCSSLREVVGIEQLEFLPQSTFAGCTSLQFEVFRSTSLKKAMGGAFSGVKIGKVDLPNVEHIEGSFAGCGITGDINHPLLKVIGHSSYIKNSIETISNLGVITTLGEQAFEENKMLKSVNLPQTLQVLGSRCFRYCELLEEIDIPSGVTSIGTLAFQYCKGLKTMICNPATPPSINENSLWTTHADLAIYVPDQSVKAYREASGWLSYADKILPMEAYLYGYIKFADPAVEAICLANWDTNGSGYLNKEEAKAVTDIGTVFKGNTEITSFDELEEFTGVTSIGNVAFQGCSSLASISLPSSIERIGGQAFYGCTSLLSLSIPSGIEELGSGAFYGCSSIVNVLFEGAANITTIKSNTFYTCNKLKAFQIPNSVLEIQDGAFYACSGLTSMQIPSGVSIIERDCFVNCYGLVEVVFADGSVLTKIGDRAFMNCNNLKILDIPNGVESIGQDAIRATGITKVVLPATLQSIGRVAFYACTSLQYVICNAIVPPTSGDKVFDATNNCPIYVPDASVDAYKAAPNWSTYADRIKPLSTFVEPTNE